MRNPERATALQRRAGSDGLALEVVALDVTDDASVAAAVRHVEDRHGAVDVLVNNAANGLGSLVLTRHLATEGAAFARSIETRFTT